MRKLLWLLIGVTLIALLSSCDKESKYEDVVKTESETVKFSKEFKKNINVVIDENSIKNDKAIIKITQPDLIKIFDEVLSQSPNDNEDKLLSEMNKNLGKYTIEKTVESAVTNNAGKWELKTSADVDNLINNAINEFLAYYLEQVKFNKISWEDAK